MKRILNDLVMRVDDRILYEGLPFSGVLYQRMDDATIEPWLVEDGMVKGRYTSNYFDVIADLPRIDVSNDIYDYDPLTYKEELFSGIGYAFVKGFCRREAYVVNGDIVENTLWGKDGNLRSYGRTRQKVSETFEWYDNAAFKLYSANTSESFFGFLRFSDTGFLQGLSSHRGFIFKLDDLLFSAKNCPVSLGESVFSFRCSSEMRFVGSDINDQLIETMLKSDMLTDIFHVILTKTSMTSEGIRKLCGNTNIKKVSIKDDNDRCRDLRNAFLEFKGIEIEFLP